MENVEKEKTTEVSKKNNKKGKLLIFIIIIVLILIVLFTIPNKKGQIEIKVKSSLDKVVEKSDLETVNISYNVIAKKCKNEDDCNTKSNDINDFKYVVSCKGTITAGIDFKDVKIDIDSKNKKIIVKVPEATIKGEPNIGSIKFLNGNEISADELPEARKLCQETTLIKSNEDNKLLPAAKEQAIIVLEEFYNQWIKAYDSSYEVEVK